MVFIISGGALGDPAFLREQAAVLMPAAVICTSGTAVANLLPAALEAHQAEAAEQRAATATLTHDLDVALRARDAAALAKWTAVNDLARQLERFVANFERNGGVVHWARDAAEAIWVEYEPLPHAVTLADALAPHAPLLSDAPDNRVAESRHGDAAKAEVAFAQAQHVVKLNITNQRVAALSIEPRSVQAHIEAGRLVIRMSSQMPTGIRTQVCDLLGLKEDQVRVLGGDVGGGDGKGVCVLADGGEYVCLAVGRMDGCGAE